MTYSYISVSNLTLDLFLKYVRPIAGECQPEEVANELTHCMTVACFNTHICKGVYEVDAEALQLAYQMEVSIKYRKNTAEAIEKMLHLLKKFPIFQNAETA